MQYGGYGHNTGGHPTRYMFPSDPSDTSPDAWSECSVGIDPSDRRFVMSAGHFSLAPGEYTDVHFAVLFVPGGEFDYPCPNLGNLRQVAAQVQALFETGWCYGSSALAAPPDVEHTPINVYPNPSLSGNYVNFEFGEPVSPSGKLQLFTYGGSMVAEYEIAGSSIFELPTKGLSQGVYFYKLAVEEVPSLQGKLLLGY